MPPAANGSTNLGLAMAISAVRAALEDPDRLHGVYLALYDDATRLSAKMPVGAPGGALWIMADQNRDSSQIDGHRATVRVRRLAPAGAGLRRAAPDESLGIDEALTALEARIRQDAAARLILLTRSSPVEYRFAGPSSARRLPVAADHLQELIAQLGATGRPLADVTQSASQKAPPPALVLHGEQHEWHVPAQADDGRAWLDPVKAAPLLRAMGIADSRGHIRRDQRRKYNQISHLAALARRTLEQLPRGRDLLVVDCGCGKSRLLMLLNYLATEELGLRAHFVGLDVDSAAIETARQLQLSLGYRNMEFAISSISEWQPPRRIDMVVSLHACDTATDEALALGLNHQARALLVVPCCQAEVASQLRAPSLEPVLDCGVMRRRLGDWLTDAVRTLVLQSAGYAVDVLEYISPLDTPKNLMIVATSAQLDQRRRTAAARALESLLAAYQINPTLPRLVVESTAPVQGDLVRTR